MTRTEPLSTELVKRLFKVAEILSRKPFTDPDLEHTCEENAFEKQNCGEMGYCERENPVTDTAWSQ